MGRVKIRGILAVLLILQNVGVPGYALAAKRGYTTTAYNDGLKPQMPNMRADDNVIPDDEFPNSGNFNNPRRPLVRPDNSSRGFRVENATIRIADVSEEFTCPLFEGKAYESVINSLDKLADAMKSTAQCNSTPTMGSVVDNTQKIRTAVNTLKPYFEKPETAFANLGEIEDGISKAVVGIDGITQAIASVSFQSTPCGTNLSGNAGFARTLSTLVTSLGPFALLGISLVPGLGIAVKAGALAIVAGASSYNEYQKLTYGRTVDMSDHEQWKAVVQNTCAYSRIVRKMNYIQRFESGLVPNVQPTLQKNISYLPTDIQTKVIAFEQKYRNTDIQLNRQIDASKMDKQKLDEVSSLLRSGRIELSRMASQIGTDPKANPEIACSVGLELARLARNNTGFPGDIIRSIELLPDYEDLDLEQSYSGLRSAYERLVEGLLLLRQDSLTSLTAVNDCAIKTMSLMDVLTRTISTYQAISKSVVQERENQLLKDPDYRRWKEEYKSVEAQKMMGQQLYTVMKNISDSSAILRSYLNRRQNELRGILFGPGNWWDLNDKSASPVYKWLDYTMNMHNASVKELMKNFQVIRNDLYALHVRRLQAQQKNPRANIGTKKLMEALALANNYEGLDIRNFNMRNASAAREHQLVCHRLLSAWDTWVQATNHLDSVGVFCDMIDPLIDVMTDYKIIKFCRGSNQDVKIQTTGPAIAMQLSLVSNAAKHLLTPLTPLAGKSIEKVALTLPAKIKAMNCNISGGR